MLTQQLASSQMHGSEFERAEICMVFAPTLYKV